MDRADAGDVQRTIATWAPTQRAALGWRVGQLERTHHIAVPQQPSGPHSPRLSDYLSHSV
jgi:hypothetical protein